MIPPAAIKIGAAVAGLVLLVFAVLTLRNEAYSRGVSDTDAKWAAASARMQAASLRAMNAADRLARAREAQMATEIKELEDAAEKGTAEPVGPGVRNVLDELRRQAHR